MIWSIRNAAFPELFLRIEFAEEQNNEIETILWQVTDEDV